MMMRKLIGVLTASVLAATVLASPADAQRPDEQRVNVTEFNGETVNGARASLARTETGVNMKISTKVGGQLYDLFAGPLGAAWEKGDATTAWFVVFNNPGECTPNPGETVPICGEDDVQDAAIAAQANQTPPAAGVGVHFATGHVAESRRWKATASLPEGDETGMVFGSALVDSMTAEVHVVVRSHGSAADLVGVEHTLLVEEGHLGTVDGPNPDLYDRAPLACPIHGAGVVELRSSVLLAGVGMGVELQDGEIRNEAGRRPDRADRDRMIAAEGDRQNPSLDQLGNSVIDSISELLRRTIKIHRIEGGYAPPAGLDSGHHVVELDMVGGLENRFGSAGRAFFPGGGIVIRNRKDCRLRRMNVG